MKVLEYVVQEIEADSKKCNYNLKHIVEIKLNPTQYASMLTEGYTTPCVITTGINTGITVSSGYQLVIVTEDKNLTTTFWAEMNTSWGIMIFTGTFPANLNAAVGSINGVPTPGTVVPQQWAKPSFWASTNSTQQEINKVSSMVAHSNSCPVCYTEAEDKSFSSFSYKYCPKCKEDIDFLAKKSSPLTQ